jgi:hypothetical protein
MGREVFLVLDGIAAWSGVIEAPERGDVLTTCEYFDEAWRRALGAGAVNAQEAGRVQFRFSAPE